MTNPTNKAILDAILALNSQVSSISTTLTSVEEQTKKTNGRVTKIEEWKNALQAIEAYKKENPTINAPNATTLVVQPKWFQNDKLVGGAVALMVAAAAVLSFFAGGVPK